MNTTHPLVFLGAEAYGTGTYDCGNFEQGCANTSTPPVSTNDGGLAYTGYNIIIPVALGAALIIAAVVLLVTKLVRRHKAAPRA